ncbi:hypothetical protein FRC07_009594, partial [Ceratobasidium sp. 392]
MDEVRCSHCNKMMSTRQACRHKREFVNGLAAGLGDPEAVPDNNRGNPGDAGMDAIGAGQQGNSNDLLLVPPLEAVPENAPVDFNDFDGMPDPDDESVVSDTDDVPIDSEDRDPVYEEREDEPGFHPDDEPLLMNDEAWAMVQLNLGDYAEEEWGDMYSRILSPKEETIMWFLASRLRIHLSCIGYDDLRLGACAPLNIPSSFIAFCRLQILSNLETRSYDCCIGSCICY